MNAHCVICSDLFDEINPIAATPCGHVYHANCLTAWLGRSKTCPECRSRTFLKSIQRLYFNFHPKSDLNSSDFENKVVRLTSELSAKDSELAACKQERERLVIDVERHESEKFQAASRIENEHFELVKSYSALEARVSELEEINATLTDDLEHLIDVRTIINGTQTDAEDILKEYNDQSNSSRQLASYCACLKRELLDAVQSKGKLMGLNTTLKSENNLYATEKRFYADAFGISQSKFQDKVAIFEQPTSLYKSGDNALSGAPSTLRKMAVSDPFPPVSVRFKSKLDMRIKAPTNGTSESQGQSNLKRENFPPAVNRNIDGVIKIELGGHHNFISSGMKKIRVTKN